MADKLPFNGPVEFNSTVKSTGVGTHSGANTFSGETTTSGELKITGGYEGKRRVVELTDSTAAPTAAQSGTIFVFDGTACTVTLPAAAAGLEYFFVVHTTQTGDAIITTASSDKLSGGFLKSTAALNDTNLSNTTTIVDAIPATTNTLTLNGTTKGGVIGSFVHVIGLATNKYHVSGTLIGSGTLVTCAS
jgi:hypothetical protein